LLSFVFKTLTLKYVAIYSLFPKILPTYCREHNNNNPRQLFDPSLVLNFVLPN